MANFTRADMEARYLLFNEFALGDQRKYYQSTLKKYRAAASQVNRLRALFAFLTGFSAAAAGLIVQTNFVDGAQCRPPGFVQGVTELPPECSGLSFLVYVFITLGVVMPALGAFFNTLADLYQWDRMIQIYDAALENIEVADAQSPVPEMDDLVYRASARAFVEGTLVVMSDETAQWGQAIRTPIQLEQFIEDERNRARRVGGTGEQQTFDTRGGHARNVTGGGAGSGAGSGSTGTTSLSGDEPPSP